LGKHDTRELLYSYTAAAINGLCRSGKADLADKIGEKAAVIAEAAMKRNMKTLADLQKEREDQD
jgi:phosphoribosyl-ATP pyrophosphohydrolase